MRHFDPVTTLLTIIILAAGALLFVELPPEDFDCNHFVASSCGTCTEVAPLLTGARRSATQP